MAVFVSSCLFLLARSLLYTLYICFSFNTLFIFTYQTIIIIIIEALAATPRESVKTNNFRKRGFSLANRCYLCQESEETDIFFCIA